MGLIDRLLRITQGRIDAFLASVEEPETVLPQLMKELRARAEDAASAEAKALTVSLAAQRRLDQSLGRALRLEMGAQLALKEVDESLAREALAEQIREERRVEEHQRALDGAERALRDARDARAQLEAELQALGSRKDEIIQRAKRVRQQQHLRESLRSTSGSLLDEVARMEERLDEQEAGIQIRRAQVTAGASVDERIRALEYDSLVAERLAAIRARVLNRDDTHEDLG